MVKIRFWSGEAGETDGYRGECASNRVRGRSLYLGVRIKIAGEVRASHAPVKVV